MKRGIDDLIWKIKRNILCSGDPEVFIVSYPKSGRTWLRALIGKYLSKKYDLSESEMLKTTWMTRKSGLPITDFTHDQSAMRDKLHYREISGDRSSFAKKKVLFVSRDFKDTLVSAYHQAVKRIKVFEGTMSEFLRDERYGVVKILTFYQVWERAQHLPAQFLRISYEDLHRDTAKTLKKALQFIGEREVSTECIGAAVEYCAFDNLKKAEKNDQFHTDILKAKSGADPDSYKVRKGKVGGYEEELSKEDIEYVDRLIADFE